MFFSVAAVVERELLGIRASLRSDWSGFEGHERQTGGKVGYARGASDPHLTGPLRGETRCTITLVDVSGV